MIVVAVTLGFCGGCAIAVFVNETAPVGMHAAIMVGFRHDWRVPGLALTNP